MLGRFAFNKSSTGSHKPTLILYDAYNKCRPICRLAARYFSAAEKKEKKRKGKEKKRKEKKTQSQNSIAKKCLFPWGSGTSRTNKGKEVREFETKEGHLIWKPAYQITTLNQNFSSCKPPICIIFHFRAHRFISFRADSHQFTKF
jgi:hypothetical protein